MKTTLIILLSLICFELHSQDGDALLRNAMLQSGDWNIVRTLTFQTRGLNYNKWQNFSFQKPIPTKDEAFRSIDFAEPAYYFKTIGRYGGGYVFEFVNVGKDTTRYVYDVLKSRNGYQLQKGGRRAFDAGLLQVNESFPFYFIRSVLQSNNSLDLKNDTTVRRTFNEHSYEEFIFNKGGHLSRFIRVQSGLVSEKHFVAYTTFEGLSYPKIVRQFSNGELTRIDEIESLSVNNKFDRKILEIPSQYKLAGSPAQMKTTQLANDIFLVENVPGGRNVMFVNLQDGVLVTEAPGSNEVSQSIINLIHQTLPGRKIIYVHLSHFHNDHINGISAFLSAGAALLATPQTIEVVKSLLNEKLTSSSTFLSFSRMHIIKDSIHEIRFYEIPNRHAEGMSFIYLPNEQIIYQGDLYSLPDDLTITPAIEVTRDFYRFVKNKKLRVKRIVGHHGASNISFEQLEKAIRLK